MIRRPPRSTLDRSSAASDVYKRQLQHLLLHQHKINHTFHFDTISTYTNSSIYLWILLCLKKVLLTYIGLSLLTEINHLPTILIFSRHPKNHLLYHPFFDHLSNHSSPPTLPI